MSKAELRELVRKKLLGLSTKQKREVSANLSRNLSGFLPSLNSKTDIIKDKLLGGFSPLRDELDWYLDLTESEIHPCVPSIGDNGEMEFHKVSWALLSREFMGLKLNKGFPLVKPKVVIVPGLAFSRRGARLGRGKGYYDRYLGEHSVYKIGICWEGQIFEEVTIEEHDVPMDAVITDQNIYIRGNEK